jgi:hypothetical protein
MKGVSTWKCTSTPPKCCLRTRQPAFHLTSSAAPGHSNIATMNICTRVATDDGVIPNIFAVAEAPVSHLSAGARMG